jgi:hypothetical protein
MRRQALLIVLFSVLLMLPAVRAQQGPPENSHSARTCRHGGSDLWDVLRIIPVRFTDFNVGTVRWQYRDPYTVKVGSFALDESAHYTSREKKEVSWLYVTECRGCTWLSYYCFHCHTLLRAYELKSGSVEAG